ncbi:MAG: tetratricopeptide repeat protein [Rhizorhabdus sp.]|uniref:tetratricopeptide repeat protein n=1 Tax=Rhizorhabdus sp. TaxID=1968843 RepID=UPI001B58D3DB|nr:hypothetical protein [Rhizorhabdus sp.]MBP8235072.1 tetratricopeptide repeat protein [Rhizorhabdus sp.]
MTGMRGAAGLGAMLLMLPGTVSAAVPLAQDAVDTPRPAYESQPPPSANPLLRAAEEDVLREPQNASARLALGAAYMSTGRFLSAEQALNDAGLLDPDAAANDLRFVLVQIALGKKAEALDRLSAMNIAGREADIGLAMALAGDIERARGLLSSAARGESAMPRLRQNLAFVEALAGNWASAATIAAQDVPPEQMADRLHRWAGVAQFRDTPALQLGALIGVTPQTDPGMPLQLALDRHDARATALASSAAFVATLPVAVPAPSPQQEPIRPAAYTGPPRMRGMRPSEADPESMSQVAAPLRTGNRSLYRAGSRRGMTVSTRAIHFPVRLVALCASDGTPVLGRAADCKRSASPPVRAAPAKLGTSDQPKATPPLIVRSTLP